MKIDKYRLNYKTQSAPFLIMMVFTIFVLGVILSTIINSTKKDPILPISILDDLYSLKVNEIKKDPFKDEIKKILINKNLPWEEFLQLVDNIVLMENPIAIDTIISQLDEHNSINPNYSAISDFLKNFRKNNLLEYSISVKQSNSQKYINRLLAVYFFHNNEPAKSLEHIRLEPTLNESELCKNLYISLLINFKKIDELETLENNPSYKQQKDKITKFILLERKTWDLLFKAIVKSLIDVKINGIFFLTLLTGFIWFGIWIHALKPEKLFSTTVLALLAFALGVFSTTITILLIYIEEDLLNLTQGTSVIQGFLFFILGVGLREEFCKLLVFLILIPILIKRHNQLEWLIIPGMVGLGFATEENLSYFLNNTESLTARFLTANFLHVALTGLAGESICHYFYNRSRGIEHFLSTFSMVVIIHGLYDSFIGIPQLANSDFSFITSIVFVLTAYLFFGRLKVLRSNSLEAISLTTHFIFGLSILFMSGFIYFSYQGGHYYAFDKLILATIELAVFIYMFLYVMPNSIIKL